MMPASNRKKSGAMTANSTAAEPRRVVRTACTMLLVRVIKIPFSVFGSCRFRHSSVWCMVRLVTLSDKPDALTVNPAKNCVAKNCSFIFRTGAGQKEILALEWWVQQLQRLQSDLYNIAAVSNPSDSKLGFLFKSIATRLPFL